MILIWTAAGPDIGAGHLGRSAAIAEACLERELAVHLLVQTDDPQSNIASLLGAVPIESQTFVGSEEEAWQAIVFHLPKTDILVSDKPGLNKADSDRLRSYSDVVLVHLTSEGVELFEADHVILGDAVISLPVRSNPFTFLGGPAFHCVRPAILNHRPSRAWRFRRGEPQRVVLCLGAADPGGLTEAITKELRPKISPHLHITVILGPLWQSERVDDFCKQYGQSAHVTFSPKHLGRILSRADLVVTLGGNTTYEALALGRPVACIRWKYMISFVSELARVGLAFDLGDDPGNAAREVLSLLATAQPREGAAERGFRLLDGYGAQRIASYLSHLLH